MNIYKEVKTKLSKEELIDLLSLECEFVHQLPVIPYLNLEKSYLASHHGHSIKIKLGAVPDQLITKGEINIKEIDKGKIILKGKTTYGFYILLLLVFSTIYSINEFSVEEWLLLLGVAVGQWILMRLINKNTVAQLAKLIKDNNKDV